MNDTLALRPFPEHDWKSSTLQNWGDSNSPLMPDHSFSQSFFSAELENSNPFQHGQVLIPSISYPRDSLLVQHQPPPQLQPLPLPRPQPVPSFQQVNYFYPPFPYQQEVPRPPVRTLSARSSEFIPKKNLIRDDNGIDIDKVKRGEDRRTTLMIRNIPNG